MSPPSLSSVRASERNTERDREVLNQPSFGILCLFFFLENHWRGFRGASLNFSSPPLNWTVAGHSQNQTSTGDFETELDQRRGRRISSDPASGSFLMEKRELPSLHPVCVPLRRRSTLGSLHRMFVSGSVVEPSIQRSPEERPGELLKEYATQNF